MEFSAMTKTHCDEFELAGSFKVDVRIDSEKGDVKFIDFINGEKLVRIKNDL